MLWLPCSRTWSSSPTTVNSRGWASARRDASTCWSSRPDPRDCSSGCRWEEDAPRLLRGRRNRGHVCECKTSVSNSHWQHSERHLMGSRGSGAFRGTYCTFYSTAYIYNFSYYFYINIINTNYKSSIKSNYLFYQLKTKNPMIREKLNTWPLIRRTAEEQMCLVQINVCVIIWSVPSGAKDRQGWRALS